MKVLEVLLYIEYAALVSAASDAPRPRGVSPDCMLKHHLTNVI